MICHWEGQRKLRTDTERVISALVCNDDVKLLGKSTNAVKKNTEPFFSKEVYLELNANNTEYILFNSISNQITA
jgi:hypothetical protein